MRKSGILAQPVIERLKQHRWAVGSVGALAALGMATAVAVVPADGTLNAANIQTVVEKMCIRDRY